MNDCSCNGTLLSWVAGNDVLLLARLYEKVLDEGEVTDLPFDLSACDDIAVTATNGYKTETLEWAIAQDESNCLAVNIPHTLTVGEWAVEITCKRNGYHVRSFEFTFRIVETNCEAQTTFEVIDGCQSASVRVALQIVPQAEVRGMNDYEQWKLVTTSEDKSLQYFLDNVINFQSRADQINAAEAQRVLKENERQGMEVNRQEAEMQREANSQAAVSAANNAAAGAERVNASLSGTTLTVTNRSGVSTSVDTKGEPGDDGVGVPSGGTAGQVLSKNSATDFDTQWINPPAAGVNSVNGKTGDVTLSASDVGALPDDTVIPDAVTEQTVSGWGFTKNTGTYSKPSGGIPSTDLSNDVQTSLGKADTALQSFVETDPTVPSWAKQPNKPSYGYWEITNTPDLSGFITKSVDDLVNYYLKSETYTKAEVAALIGAIQQFHYEIYASTSAVTTPANNVLYLIGPTGSGSDKYEEYVYDSTKESPWIKIGDTSIDLSGYYTSSQTDTAISTALADYTTTANLTTLLAAKANSADLATVATSGSYNDLSNTPTIPDVTGKADKVSSATSGNFAALDGNGNLTDSGHKHSDYLTQHQDLSNYVQKSQTAGLLKNDGTVDTNTYLTQHQDISGKQDKIDATHKLSADLVEDGQNNKSYTAAEKGKLGGIEAGAEVNVQANWNESNTSSDAYIQNKPDNLAYIDSTQGSATIASFDPQTDTVWTKAQTLSAASKATARNNIGAQETLVSGSNIKTINNEPLLGSGNISAEKPVVIEAPVNATDATLPITALSCEVGKYYRLDVAVETLAVTLPAMTDLTTVRTVVIYLTAGTTPAVTISAADSKDVYYQDGFEIEAGSTYEINALFNGSAWIVAGVKIVVPEAEEEGGE